MAFLFPDFFDASSPLRFRYSLRYILRHVEAHQQATFVVSTVPANEGKDRLYGDSF